MTSGPRGPLEAATTPALSAARAQVLEALRASGRPMTVKQLADAFDLHTNTVREHLDALVADELAVRESSSPTGRGRPALYYRAASGTREMARDYQLLSEVLADQIAVLPNPVEVSVRAGQNWGEQMLARGEAEPGVTGVVDVMGRMGFDPDAIDANGDLMLRSCPILTAARRQPDVVCQVHKGLAMAMVAADGHDPDRVGLEPFGHPEGCVLHLP